MRCQGEACPFGLVRRGGPVSFATIMGAGNTSRKRAGWILALFVLALGFGPLWHGVVHHDAAEPEHQCVLTALTKGELLAPDATSELPVPTVDAAAGRATESAALPRVTAAVFWSRGPPV